MLKFVVPGGRAAVQGKRRRGVGVTSRVLCIDIGVHNMGVAELEREGSSPPRFLSGRKIDITDNGGCRGEDCDLGHTGAMADWVAHLVRYDKDFRAASDQADLILIERQPPCGFRDCEQLLFSIFRTKAVLVHPRSLHAHFKIGSLSYEERKVAACRISNWRFRDSKVWQAMLASHARQHDVADAALMGLWAFERRRDLIERHRPTVPRVEALAGEWMEGRALKRRNKCTEST